ncbi:MAG: LamG-like jellyroll fold domain-containing protein, partial [Planctomycetota bacterium]
DSFSMTGVVGTTYYTTDGSDPRLPMTSEVTGTTLVSRDMPKRAHVPDGPISDNWRGGGNFDDSSWTYIAESPGGVGYDERDDYKPYISYDVETLMNEDRYPATAINTSAMIRIPFTVSAQDVASFNFMTLKVQYDDGFVAFLNGQRMDDQNVSGSVDDPAWNANAGGNHEASGSFDTFDVTDDLGKLEVGGNILAIQGLNTSMGSSDFIINAELVAGASTASGGQPSPSALAYNEGSSLKFDKSTHIKARNRNGGIWSALNEATYGLGPVAESLRISEIMYHPLETGDPNDPNEEFVELTNIGPQTINLNLVKFTNGIDFTFADLELAPGQYVVAVKNESAFTEAHPEFSGIIAGEYVGSLDNGGERVELADATGETILNFRYNDGWRRITDGLGFSLTNIDPSDNSRAVSEEGLFAHWALDDGSGAVATDSVGTNDGTVVGAAEWTVGPIAGALKFDGGDDHILLSSIDALTGDSMTLEAWAYLTDVVYAFNPILTQHTPSGNGCYFYFYDSKPTFSMLSAAGYAEAVSPESVGLGRWYHIAGTHDGSNLRIYVDGELKHTVSAGGIAGSSYDAYIGYDIGAATHFKGILDDVRIYNRPLSEYEFEGMGDWMERWGDKDSWRASAYVGGSPGWDDSGIVPNPGAVVINEIMAHSHAEAPDWIELHNTADEDI